MKLKYEMEMVEIGEEITAVPLGCDKEFSGIVQMNSSAASIIKLLEKETDEDTIVAQLKKEYDADEEILRRNVHAVVEKLRAKGLLAE